MNMIWVRVVKLGECLSLPGKVDESYYRMKARQWSLSYIASYRNGSWARGWCGGAGKKFWFCCCMVVQPGSTHRAMMLRGRNSKRRGSMAISRGATIAMDPAIEGKGSRRSCSLLALLALAWLLLPSRRRQASSSRLPTSPRRSFIVASGDPIYSG